MKSQFLSAAITSVTILFSASLAAQGFSYKTLDTCQKNYAELLDIRNLEVASVAELPPGIYLARSVTQRLENANEKYFSYQSLLENSKASPDVCYKGMPSSSIRTQSFIPTVIDQTQPQKLGHTFWSLSAVINKMTGAIYSKRSLIPNKNYREALRNQGYKIVASQKNHDEYQIHLERNIASWKETIVITYDQF